MSVSKLLLRLLNVSGSIPRTANVVMRTFRHLFISFAIIIGLQSFCRAQSYYFRHFTTDDGLSHNTVFSVIQDRKGFIWLGTKDGLNRFDGFNFKKFINIHHQFGSIGDDQIHALCEDAGDKIWLATGRGLYQFDPQQENFSKLVLKPSKYISGVISDGKKSIWFLAADTLYRYNTKNKRLVNYNIQASCISINEKQQVLIGNARGQVLQFNPVNGQIKRFLVISEKLPASQKNITSVVQGAGDIIVGTGKLGLLSFNPFTGKSTALIRRNQDGTAVNVRAVVLGEPGKFWVATESGVFIYDAHTKTTTVFQKDQADPYALNDNAIYAFCRDRDGGMWIGTYFGGLNYYTAKNSRFRKYYHLDKRNSITGNAISAICEDQQHHIWIGTEDAGISCLDVKRGDFRNFRPDGRPNSLGNSNVHSMFVAGNKLFAGLLDHGVEVLDINTGLITERYNEVGEPNVGNSNFVLCLLRSKLGKIYLGTVGINAGLYEFNQQTKRITDVSGFRYRDGVFSLIEDHLGRLWVGSPNKGVFYYDGRTGKTVNIKFGDSTGLTEATVHCIYEDSKYNLWFGTEGGGVIKLNRDGITRTRYTTSSGLSSNYIFRIVEDDNHHIWMSSVKGLMRMDGASGKISTYTRDNGLITDQFNYSSSYRAADGSIYFGSIKGLVAFHPEDFNQVLKPPPLYLTTLEINNEVVLGGKKDSPLNSSISYTDDIVLAHDQNNVNLEFAALDYSAAKAIKYRYRLRGLSDAWIYLSRNRKVYFTGLTPGKYIFEYAAESNTGEWTTAIKRVPLQILPPLYLTNIAYLLYALTAFWIGYYLFIRYKRYINNQHRRKLEQYEHEKSQEIYQSKINFFTNIAHELRTPLTLIKLPLDQLNTVSGFGENVKENLTMINKNTNRLIELTNQLLDFRKSDQENLRLIFVKTNINTLLEDIYADFQIIAQQKKLDYQLELPKHITLHAHLDIEAFKKIIVNLLSNAFKYAERTVTIRMVPINSEDDFFSLQIINDGLLIPEKYHEKVFEPFFRINENDKNSGSGIGLSLARSLALMHNGTLTLTTNAQVNVFTVDLPLHQQTEIDFMDEREADTDQLSGATESKLSAQGLTTVLLVEDHADILKYIGRELQGEYFILMANDGVEALEILENHPVQLVVSDIMMPRMDGLELCRRIKTDLTYSHIPVILLTAKNSVDSRIEGLGTGADAYIDKPFSMSHLEIQIKSLLRNRKLVKEHFARSPLSQIKGVAYSKIDVSFLEQLTNAVSSRLSDSVLDVELLSKTMNMSRPTLYRKIKALTNMTPSAFIALYRLKQAAELLAAKQYKINEIAFMVGYNSPANFTRDFQKQFGMTPSVYIKELS